MKVLVQITHPAHVHFFRNFITEAIEKGHDIRTIALEKEITLELLDLYEIEYQLACEPAKRDVLRARTQARLDWGTLKHAREFDPDVITAIGGTSAAHVSAVTDAISVIWYDTEHARLQNAITYPFADIICTPSCYERDVFGNHLPYQSYQELAYLHPNRFQPDPNILDRIGIDLNEKCSLVLLRTVSWDAAHDFRDGGLSDIAQAVRFLESCGAKVVITAEGDLPAEIEDRRATVPPNLMHDLMAAADLYIGESATMATESALLGTPAVFVSSSTRGYTNELEKKYGMVFNFHGKNRGERAMEKAQDILEDPNTEQWRDRRNIILEDKMDTTSIMLSLILDN